jgi:divalent metal cation (Fe/Co/Zn/Cd) transporter
VPPSTVLMLTTCVAMKIAKERKSSVLASNAVHHRVDSLTSIVALVAIGGAHLLNGAAWLDPVGGLIVSLMVIQAGFGNTVQAVYELCDATVDEEVKEKVRRVASAALPSEEVELRDVQGVKAGQNYLLDIELAAPAQWSLIQMQKVEDDVRENIGAQVRGAKRIRIRFMPKEKASSDFMDEFISADISPRSSPEPEDDHDHHHHGHDHSHSTSKADGNADDTLQRKR